MAAATMGWTNKNSPRAEGARPYVWMAVVALLLRVALIFWLHSYELPPYGDEQLLRIFRAYGRQLPSNTEHFYFGGETGSIARAIATGEGFSSPFGDHTGPTAWVAPVYPYLCAGVFLLFGLFSPASRFVILFLNGVFAALTCISISLIGERTIGRQVGLWAGWAWAVVPPFMQWPAGVWETTLSALLLSLLFLFALELSQTRQWKKWLQFGLLWGVAALTNPALLSFLPFSLAWPAWHWRRQGKSYAGLVAAALLACFLVVTPWLVRNRLVFGQAVFIRSNFWFEFHMGNYHFSHGMGWPGKHPMRNPAELEKYQRLGELGYVASVKQQALEFVRHYPGEFALLTLKRIRYFWDGTVLRYSSPHLWPPWMVVGFSALAGLGLLHALGRRVHGAFLFAWLVLSYPSVYYITHTQFRYRHALEPQLLLLAVFFLYEATLHFRGKLRRR